MGCRLSGVGVLLSRWLQYYVDSCKYKFIHVQGKWKGGREGEEGSRREYIVRMEEWRERNVGGREKRIYDNT